MRLERVGRRRYESPDKRYLVAWVAKQGARSCWQVTDREGHRTLRAFTLAEARETLREMIAKGR